MVKAEPLRDILKDILTVYSSLLELSEKKEQLLSSGEIEGLESLIEQEEQLIVLAGKLDVKRGACQDALREELGLPQDALLNDLAGHLEDEEINCLKQEIMETASKLNEVNKTNARLLKNALDYTVYSLEKMTGQEKQTYDHKLGDKEQSRQSIIDRKV